MAMGKIESVSQPTKALKVLGIDVNGETNQVKAWQQDIGLDVWNRLQKDVWIKFEVTCRQRKHKESGEMFDSWEVTDCQVLISGNGSEGKNPPSGRLQPEQPAGTGRWGYYTPKHPLDRIQIELGNIRNTMLDFVAKLYEIDPDGVRQFAGCDEDASIVTVCMTAYCKLREEELVAARITWQRAVRKMAEVGEFDFDRGHSEEYEPEEQD